MSPPIPSTTTTTDTTVPPADSAAAPEASANPPAPTPATPDPWRPRIAVEGGFSFTDLANGGGLFNDHSGFYGRAEGGFEYRISSDFFAQANLAAVIGGGSRNLGEGVSSSHSYEGFTIGGRFGVSFLDGNLRLTAGVDIGTYHVGASACSDGLRCGAEYARNALLLPIDSWGLTVDGEVGISTLGGGIALYGRIGSISGVNPHPQVVDPSTSNPDFGLNIPFFQLGLGVEVFSLINFFTGQGSSSSQARSQTSEEPAETPASDSSETTTSSSETTEAAPESQSGESAASVPTGLGQVQAQREAVSQAHDAATHAADLVSSARTAYLGITGAAAEQHRMRRVQVLEALNQARTAIQQYQHIHDLIGQARESAGSLHGTESREAQSAIREMTRAEAEARRVADRAFREARTTAQAFNRLASHGEDIAIDLEDPTPPVAHDHAASEHAAEGSAPSPHHDATREEPAHHPETSGGSGSPPVFHFPTDSGSDTDGE